MPRLPKRLENLYDTEVSMYKNGKTINIPTLTSKKATVICEYGKVATSLNGISKINKVITLKQSYKILLDGCSDIDENNPIHPTTARNILYEFGEYYYNK